MTEGTTRESPIKRNDIILLAFLAGCSVFMFAGRAAFGYGQTTADERVVVIRDGETVGEYSLDSDAEFTVESGDGEFNRVVIRDGSCFVEEASCPDGLCIKRGGISLRGEAIICLPNRLSIEVKGGDGAGEIDVISR